MASTRTLAFEIGTEEIPAFDLKNATEKLPQIMSSALTDARIAFGGMEVFSTPRRMAVVVRGVEESLNKEALRIIGRMPRWVAGKIGDTKVPVYCIIAIPFRR